MQRILHSDLHLFPYKIDKERRLQFALWTMEENAVFHNTRFIDEAYIHVNSVVNKQNVRFWTKELPHTLHEKENYGGNLMCGPQFQPTESSVHFSFMTPSAKKDTTAFWNPPSLGNRSPYTRTVVHAGWSPSTHRKRGS